MTTHIRSDFIIHCAAPPKDDEYRSNLIIGKAAYAPRLLKGNTAEQPLLLFCQNFQADCRVSA
ncbi:MAG: hypothetical protein V7676_16625 [Parasphingorhabdus sp.]|uniref:hypothetical protein n=1 Tax=Parasphingorhabdus sp. TaxID=2709688 RepID=UPI0030034174